MAQSSGYDTENMKMTDEHKKAHFVRFPELNAESLMDFAGGFKNWQKEYRASKFRQDRVKFIRSLGYSSGRTDLGYEQCHIILMQDPKYAAYIRLSRSIQELMWDRALSALNANADMYMSAMEATDKSGPGSLELNPTMDIPDYTTHEIHEQPGGYVGHPFAGWLYHYALALAFYQGMSDGEVRHDETHYQIAARTQVPEDGKVRRILEIGCSDGRTTIALKERFPDAEVWGIDVGGPMVRYAHHRSVGLGLDINFAQRLAEDTHFPDNYFDLVVANLVFHEVAAFATKKIYPEIHRITRKGGVWSGDGAGGNRRRRGSIVSNAATWVNHRYNNETWQLEWEGLEPNDLLNDAGFVIDRSGGRPLTVKA